MVIPRRRLMVLLCCAGLLALLMLAGSLGPGTASAKPYNWADFPPTYGGTGDPTGDDQPSPTPKTTKVAPIGPNGGTVGVEPVRHLRGRISTMWFVYRRLLPFGPLF